MTALHVAFITACTALISAIAGPFITFRIGKAQIVAAVVSASRQKWIDQFRSRVASFCSQALVASLLRDRLIQEGRIVSALDPDLLKRIQDLVETFHTIELLANPAEKEHEDAVRQLGAILTTLRRAPLDTDLEQNLDEAIAKVVATTQRLLKREWARVKQGG